MQHLEPAFSSAAATHSGRVRERNEDCYLVRPETGLWAVADGMGGEHAGDVASAMVISELQAIEPQPSATALLARCEAGIVRANGRLKELAADRGAAVIGTTVVMLLTFEAYYACIWSGDSRVYRIRDGDIVQLSRDHTEVQELVSDGVLTADEARLWPGRNVITRAIGVQDEPELELEYGVLEQGDTFVLCSDGLTVHVADNEIRDIVSARAPQEACDALIELTLSRGAVDNVTVVVVRYQPNGAPLASSSGGSAYRSWE
jgi:protein phosphatase